ncbi:MAG TPA: type II secretion system protein [Planctomycetota bacterium]|nr:type II secretion system protein [Planctomycetota bacterium]
MRDRIKRLFGLRKSRRNGFTLLELLVVISIVLFMLAFLVGVFLRQGNTNKIRATQKLIERIGIGLARYYADLRCYPPDTGFGLAKMTYKGTLVPGTDTGVIYDTGSLWRYLGREVAQYRPDGKGGIEYWRTLGPYVKFTADELAKYSDSEYSYDSYYVVDAWYNPIGYIADTKRVVHNRGEFDLFSSGPDKKTAGDDGVANSADVADGTPNTAYDGAGRDDAAELGEAVLNGSLTAAKRDHMKNGAVQFAGEVLDDINNWDPQK